MEETFTTSDNDNDEYENATLTPSYPQNASDTSSVEWTPQAVIAVAVASLLAIATTVGSVMVILVVVRFKRLQIPSNYILINLAAADISVAVFVPLLLLSEMLGQRLFEKFYLCLLPYSLVTLGCGVSLLSLGMVAYDRYAALVKSLKYCQHITTKRIIYLSAAVWLYVFIVASASFCSTFLIDSPAEVQSKCGFVMLNKYVILFQIVAMFAPVFVLMIGCYCRVMLVARHHSRAISAIQLSVFPNALNKNVHMFKGTKYSRTLLIILGCFFLTWGVFIVALTVELFCDVCRRTIPFHKYAFFLIFAHSCVNPWIYAHRNKDFKAAFRRIACTFLWAKKKPPSSANTDNDGRRNSRYSDALSRTNSMVGGLQHLHALYDNVDIIPTREQMPSCKPDSKISFKVAPKLIQHEMIQGDATRPKTIQADTCQPESTLPKVESGLQDLTGI